MSGFKFTILTASLLTFVAGELYSTSLVAKEGVNYTYFIARQDYRKCMYPMCGGYWIKKANKKKFRCADGVKAPECYVVDIDFEGLGLAPKQIDEIRGNITNVLIRGDLENMDFPEIPGDFEELVTTEAWMGVVDAEPTGKFYRLTDSGIRCFTSPCPSIREGFLNKKHEYNIHEVDLHEVGATPEQISAGYDVLWGTADGLMAAGTHYQFKENGQKAKGFTAEQFFLRVIPNPCLPTGCSGQICADVPVITTCEWRPEYACIKMQICEVQSDGICGWTSTDESKACFDDLATPFFP